MPISYVTPRLTETHNIEQVKFVKILGVIFKTGEITSNTIKALIKEHPGIKEHGGKEYKI